MLFPVAQRHIPFLATLLLILCTTHAGRAAQQDAAEEADYEACCDLSDIPGLVWVGDSAKITLHELATYAAPVFWFSPDEPLLQRRSGKAIRIPEPLPFEKPANAPVVYYQVNTILVRVGADGPAYHASEGSKDNAIIDLDNTSGIDLKYICYFSREVGLGSHLHDVEPAEFNITVIRRDECVSCRYLLQIERVVAEAHGLHWYFNILDVNEYTTLPIHLLVEEGKHALCTDKNGDGYYTPGFDVSERFNDAWGVRDVIRSGTLFTGGYQAWMAKVRHPRHRIFPPLPADSPLRDDLLEGGTYSPNNAIYELRPFPPSSEAIDLPLLRLKMAEKEKKNWPVEHVHTDLKRFERWLQATSFLKSISVAFRADGEYGVSFVFPLLLFKNVEEPMAGGFLVNRIYLRDRRLRDFGWMLMYTPSASRWFDGYFAAGVEWNRFDVIEGFERVERHFVQETGVKFRVNITKSPLKFLGALTEFWGLRAGIKNKGFYRIDELVYVLELGAGTW